MAIVSLNQHMASMHVDFTPCSIASDAMVNSVLQTDFYLACAPALFSKSSCRLAGFVQPVEGRHIVNEQQAKATIALQHNLVTLFYVSSGNILQVFLLLFQPFCV